jgi:hypothetical protein
MTRSIFAQSVARRTLLAGVGAGVVGALLRPLQAQEAAGPPKRVLFIHRPCGTVLADWFPTGGDARNFTLPKILQPLEAFKQDMIVLDDVTCPRETSWPGDQHAAGLITMMCGKRFVSIPGTDASGDPNAKNIVAPDKTIDQHLLTALPAVFGGTRIPSIEATAYPSSEGGLPSFKVMSYEGNNKPRFPESNPQDLFNRVFTDPNAGLSAEEIARRQDQRKSVLDRVNADLARLSSLVPASQKPKLESHLQSIKELESALQAGAGGNPVAMCDKPTLAPLPGVTNGATEAEATHLTVSQQQLSIINAAFQCDLTRVASFTFAHGNSELRFPKIDPGVVKGNGHHSTSHDTTAEPDQSRIDQIYSEQLALLLNKMRAVQESNGTLLDNTLVVYFNEVSWGNTHTIDRMPVLLIGGKNLGLQGGQNLRYQGRYMNDVWAAICGQLGAPATFGDPGYFTGPVSGLFA